MLPGREISVVKNSRKPISSTCKIPTMRSTPRREKTCGSKWRKLCVSSIPTKLEVTMNTMTTWKKKPRLLTMLALMRLKSTIRTRPSSVTWARKELLNAPIE